jgi:hypothetical protein
MRKAILFALALLAIPSLAVAADEPILSFKRLTFAAGVNRVFVKEVMQFTEVGVYGAYNLVPRLSIAGSVTKPVGIDADALQSRIGVRLRLAGGQ